MVRISYSDIDSHNEDELMEFTVTKHKAAFEKYGVHGAFDDYFKQMAAKELADPKKADKLRNELMGDKVFVVLEEILPSETKEISYEEFIKL